jgi:putative flavoprotein involved in K+ transport
MTMPEIIDYLEGYARSFAAPLQDETTVLAVEEEDAGYRIDTNRGSWRAKNVVIATGYCDVPYVPDMAGNLSKDIVQLDSTKYRNPGELPAGGVLVVGASATGIQLADEIHSSGRPAMLAVGRHTRLPRTYRGKDILWWLEAMGVFGERLDQVYDAEISRRQPSLQLVGRTDRSSLDLMSLEANGVRLVGRANGAEDANVSFADDLIAYTAAADVKLARLLQRIEAFAAQAGLTAEVDDAEPFNPFHWPAQAPTSVDLRSAGIRTVLWATGFRRSYPWLKVPVLDGNGEIRHQGGITPAPGLYVLGLQFQRRRNSVFIDGVGSDANELAEHMADRLRNDPSVRAGSSSVICGTTSPKIITMAAPPLN